MIDVFNEHLVPIRDVPRLLPPQRTGRPVHLSAVYRWIGRGLRGVRLEAVKVGGSTYTSAEALQRFADQLSARPAKDSQKGTLGDAKRLGDVTRRVEQLLRGGRKDGGRAQEGDKTSP